MTPPAPGNSLQDSARCPDSVGAIVEHGLDVERLRADFPILGRSVHGHGLVYLDSAATTQKPRAVIDAIARFYEQTNSNVHRGVHTLSQEATQQYEAARRTAAAFLNAESPEQIIFVRGTTEAINLVAQTYGRDRLRAGDEILITTMEHHSNIVPWQILCQQTGAVLRVAPINDAGELLLDEFEKLLTDKTRLVSVVHVSNALGTVNPVKQIAEMAHRRGAAVLVDGAQAVAHLPVDVRDLDCDFYALSGHKLYGPMGIGVLYGRRELLEAMSPYQSGGDMIKSVTFEKTLYNDLPYRFEAGTPNVGGAIGLAKAIDYLAQFDRAALAAHEQDVLQYGQTQLVTVPGLKMIGTAAQRRGVLSFVLDGIHPHDVGTVLDSEGVAIRTGHHCAQPVMQRFGIAATARASLGLYNRRADIDALVAALHKTIKVFA